MQLIFAVLLISVALIASAQEAASSLATSGTAASTFYESYPRCCCGQGSAYKPNGPNCDPNAKDNIEECTENSGCEYQGDFAADGHQSLDWVKSHNIASFFDRTDPNGKNFQTKYGKKTIQVTSGSIKFNATIADTCLDSDCGGCCTRNAKNQGVDFLCDLEYYTVLKYFGSTGKLPAKVSFVVF